MWASEVSDHSVTADHLARVGRRTETPRDRIPLDLAPAALLGTTAELAESYERIHRLNLIGMGVLPPQFPPGQNATTLGLSGREARAIRSLADRRRLSARSGSPATADEATREREPTSGSTQPAKRTTTATEGTAPSAPPNRRLANNPSDSPFRTLHHVLLRPRQLPGFAAGDAATNSVDSEPVFSAHSGDPRFRSAHTIFCTDSRASTSSANRVW